MQANTQELVSALKGITWQERQNALEMLGELEISRDTVIQKALIEALDDHVYWVRRSAALALARSDDKKVADLLLGKFKQALGDDNPMLKMMALENLTFINDIRSYKTLIETLRQDDPLLFHIALNGVAEKQEAYALFELQEMKGKKKENKEQLTQAIDQLKTAASQSLALEESQPVCRHCLRRFHKYKLKTGFMSNISFYGCRLCGLARNRLEGVGTIVAVMDTPWQTPYLQKDDTLLINMCMREKDKNYLVDFDLLEIRATPDIDLNEEMKYLLMRSGNDITMNPEKMKDVPVRLVAAPSLNQNSLNLIKFKTKGVMER